MQELVVLAWLLAEAQPDDVMVPFEAGVCLTMVQHILNSIHRWNVDIA